MHLNSRICREERSHFWRRLLPFFVSVVVATSANSLNGSEQISEQVQFSRDVASILTSHCFGCHGPDAESRKADLRLDQLPTVIVRSATDTTIINPGQPQFSELLLRVTSEDEELRMPPPDHGPALSTDQIRTLRLWIQQGAEHSKHWAFIPPERPALPLVRNQDWPQTAVDRFVLHRLESEGIEPSTRARPHTLLRRISLDLKGIPPTVDRIKQFTTDTSPAAWQVLVERLLSSPQFGERMAQSWLDAARYADTTGHAADKPRTMWLYRDWVIDAFNSNMPFDKFTVEQLAGDLLPEATESQRIATGFHRNSMQALGNNPRKEEFRVKGIVDRLEATGRAWLGLTIGCAECHDHKYDPISQKEYYQLFAIFNNVPHLGEKFDVHGPRISVQSKLTKAKIANLKTRLDQARDCLDPEEFAEDRDTLRRQIAELQKQTVTAQIMGELEQPRQSCIHVRGNFENRGAEVQPALPSLIADSNRDGKPGNSANDRLINRLVFAKSLVDRQNPLTARVLVNRIWKHYLGQGLVSTVDDFGLRGDYPTHPQLLDWLAVELIDSGWDMKHVHRLIVSSATYQQSSNASPKLIARDPQNRLLARGARFRLEAEQIRDVAIFASGLMDFQIGGPGVFPRQDPTIGQFRDDTAGKWINSPGRGQYRRALYTFWQRMSPYPSMVLFDAPSREQCAVDRPRTNTPLQALTTLNDPFFVDLARHFGRRIQRSANSSTDRIHNAFMQALSRPPTADELSRFNQYIDGRDDEQKWFRFAQIILNLDESISRE